MASKLGVTSNVEEACMNPESTVFAVRHEAYEFATTQRAVADLVSALQPTLATLFKKRKSCPGQGQHGVYGGAGSWRSIYDAPPHRRMCYSSSSRVWRHCLIRRRCCPLRQARRTNLAYDADAGGRRANRGHAG